MRAEKNRQSARESRMRKQQYIEYLLTQVIQLRRLVEIYSFRLSKYELIEKYCDLSTQACFNEIDGVHNHLNKLSFGEVVKQMQKKMLDERQYVMEMVTKKLIEVTFPMPVRVSLWLNDNNIDCHNIEE
jgi:hypothetical protein